MIRITKLAALALAVLTALPATADTTLKPVKLIVADAGGAEMTRQFFGRVVARETVDLAFQVGGQLIDFPLIEGEQVKQGDLVAQLDLETFQLALEQARLQRDQADRALARLRQLSESTASPVRIEDAETALALADVAVRNAEYALDHATLTAPFDALVATRNVANFTTIGAGTPVVRLHDMSEMRIEVDIPEVLFLRARAAPNVRIRAKFPASDQTYPLELREFNAETSKVGQSFRVTLGMTPPPGMRFLPGASVTVIAETLSDVQGGLLVPRTAVFTDADGATAVMVFAPKGADQGTVAMRKVDVAPAPQDGIVITSGLEPGTEIVAAGTATLTDGQNVRRFTGFGN